jgi:hypothetical protein
MYRSSIPMVSRGFQYNFPAFNRGPSHIRITVLYISCNLHQSKVPNQLLSETISDRGIEKRKANSFIERKKKRHRRHQAPAYARDH